MKKKTINAILSKKFGDWVKTITDEKVKNLVEKNSMITGGAVVSLLQNESPKDYDVYFTNKETTKAVAQYYIDKYKSVHPDVAISLIDGAEVTEEEKARSNSFIFKNLSSDRIKIIVPSKGVESENKEILNSPFEDVYDVITELDDRTEEDLEKIEETEKKEKYRPIFFSSNAITLSNGIQIVIRFYGEPEQIHENYDFVHCTNYWTPSSGTILKQAALESIMAKELFYVGSKYPLCSVIRTRKFIKRGWTINAGQYLKMMFQISELNLSNIDVLEDQLVGVDSAYFDMLIKGLRQKCQSDPSFSISQGYLTTIIDKIF